MAKSENKFDRSPETVALYEKLVATVDGAERKGDNIPYTSLNGNMYSFLTTDGPLALRLPKDQIEPFLKKYKTVQPVQYGAVMKEYVLVPDALLKKTTELKKYFALSFEYASSLKPKATKRTKK